MTPELTLVVAVARNGVIGLDGTMPWHLPADLKHFKAVTLGKPILMGRRTWQSIGRPLPGRRNLVLSRSPDFRAPGAEVLPTLSAALAAVDAPELMVIGGSGLYAEALPRAARIHRTLINATPEGDTFFPALDEAAWRLVDEEHRPPDEKNPYALTFQQLERRSVPL